MLTVSIFAITTQTNHPIGVMVVSMYNKSTSNLIQETLEVNNILSIEITWIKSVVQQAALYFSRRKLQCFFSISSRLSSKRADANKIQGWARIIGTNQMPTRVDFFILLKFNNYGKLKWYGIFISFSFVMKPFIEKRNEKLNVPINFVIRE